MSIPGVCETWLILSVVSSSVAVRGFHVVRGDESVEVEKHGGCLYLSELIHFVPLDIQLKNVAWVYLVDLDIYVVVVYRPPAYDYDDDELLRDFLQNICIGREVLLMGDFKLATLKWDRDDVLAGYVKPRDSEIYYCFNELRGSPMDERRDFYGLRHFRFDFQNRSGQNRDC